MNIQEVRDAWAAAQESDRSDEGHPFYVKFFQLTGLREEETRRVFKEWNHTRRDRVEEIAAKHEVIVEEAGFQAFLVERFWPEDPEMRVIQKVEQFLRLQGQEYGVDVVSHALDAKVRIGRYPMDLCLVGPPSGQGDPREYKSWPSEEDCPTCPGQVGDNNTHKLSCASQGAVLKVPAVVSADGSIRIPLLED